MVCAGVWGVGLATPLVQVDKVPLGGDNHSWVLTSEGTTIHNAEVITTVKERLGEGDIVVSENLFFSLPFSPPSLFFSSSLPSLPPFPFSPLLPPSLVFLPTIPSFYSVCTFSSLFFLLFLSLLFDVLIMISLCVIKTWREY